MSSLLLYEAWLLGHPTLSLQPDLKIEELAQLDEREGLNLCRSVADIPAAVKRLINAKYSSGSGRRDLALHKDAPGAVLFCAV